MDPDHAEAIEQVLPEFPVRHPLLEVRVRGGDHPDVDLVLGDNAAALADAVLEGRNLIEHYVSRPADDVSQIHGNIYLGRVQNVLPGMEAAFVEIGLEKNGFLYVDEIVEGLRRKQQQ